MKAFFRYTAPTLLVLFLSGGLGFAAPAPAEGGAAGPATPPPASEGPASGGAAAGAPSGADWVQQQIDRLHRQLRITAAQEPLWTQFADARRANAKHLEQLYEDRSAHYRTMNALELAQNRRDIAQAQAEDLAKEVAAFQALYGSLAPEQKQAADRIYRYQEERREQRRMARGG